MIASKISALRSRLPEENDRVDHCQENHAGIVRLIRAGDVPRAQAALALHIRDTRDSYIGASRIDARHPASAQPPLRAGNRRREAGEPA